MTEQKPLIPLGPGERLQLVRERHGISLADASNISERILGAIESQQVESIPYVYLRGYVRNYARFLRIPDEESRQFLSGFENSEPQVQSIFPRMKRNPADRYLKAFSYVLASLLIGTLAWQVTHEAVRLSQGRNVATSVEDSVSSLAVTETETDKGDYVNASIASLENLPGRYGRSDQAVAGQGVGEQAWSVLDEAAGNGTDALPVVPEGMSLLTLSVSADSWVEINDIRGERLEMDLLRGGSLQHYVGEPPFSLLLGRSSAIELLLDGEPVQLESGKDGDARRMTVGKPLVATQSDITRDTATTDRG
jgi:cytoskeleton protein RodZ